MTQASDLSPEQKHMLTEVFLGDRDWEQFVNPDIALLQSLVDLRVLEHHEDEDGDFYRLTDLGHSLRAQLVS
ncbi:hypothetical protein [Erythrobacter aureus]|uniref:DUF2087 domain-containing protein n=1 Tax=Erythrobacter aureus TaxID=2182384 RepID=A0A345YJM5_9SPHN|nr:hypothetical protein [Erythrobacter aureus]AXK44127.1 hypothetical protein DVR09_16880 [Erythrobacter aureus]